MEIIISQEIYYADSRLSYLKRRLVILILLQHIYYKPMNFKGHKRNGQDFSKFKFIFIKIFKYISGKMHVHLK